MQHTTSFQIQFPVLFWYHHYLSALLSSSHFFDAHNNLSLSCCVIECRRFFFLKPLNFYFKHSFNFLVFSSPDFQVQGVNHLKFSDSRITPTFPPPQPTSPSPRHSARALNYVEVVAFRSCCFPWSSLVFPLGLFFLVVWNNSTWAPMHLRDSTIFPRHHQLPHHDQFTMRCYGFIQPIRLRTSFFASAWISRSLHLASAWFVHVFSQNFSDYELSNIDVFLFNTFSAQ